MSDKVECTMLAVGTSFGLAQIETTLGIIFLAVQLTILITKVVCKIIDAYKTKDLSKIIEIAENAKEEVNEIEEHYNERNK